LADQSVAGTNLDLDGFLEPIDRADIFADVWRICARDKYVEERADRYCLRFD